MDRPSVRVVQFDDEEDSHTRLIATPEGLRPGGLVSVNMAAFGERERWQLAEVVPDDRAYVIRVKRLTHAPPP